MLEAMACGALLIGSATPPVQEVIRHGVNGLLAPFFDEARLAKTVIAALGRGEELMPLRAAARQTVVARYEREACIDRQLGFIGRLVAEGDLLAAQ
jgi:glycosyltransferase involved in cell wall biosynthesis